MLGAMPTPSPQPAPAEIEQIFRDHHALVFRAAYRLTGNPSDAEDVLQTVFLRLLRRDSESQAVGNISGYLHRAAVNSALDLIRARQHARSVPLDDVAPVLAENASLAPDRAHSSAEMHAWLRDAIARLSPPGRRDLHSAVFRGQG